VFFRSADTAAALASLSKIFTDTNMTQIIGFYVARKEVLLFLALSSVFIFLIQYLKPFIIKCYERVPIYVSIVLIILFFQLIIQVKDNVVEPFIYFQF
jgi:hypothetical protein